MSVISVFEDQIEASVIHAVDEPELSREFFVQQARSMRDFLPDEDLYTLNPSQATQPGVYLILISWSSSGQFIAGIRVHTSQVHPLPMAEATQRYDVGQWVQMRREEGGIAEICGLWVARGARKMGLPLVLTQAGASVAAQLGLPWVSCFVHPYSKPFTDTLGWDHERFLGTDGYINYPDERYPSAVMTLDPIVAANAPAESRVLMEAMRSRPGHLSTLSTVMGDIPIKYNLCLHPSEYRLPGNARVSTQSQPPGAQVAEMKN